MNDIEDRLRHQLPLLADAIIGGETIPQEGESGLRGPSEMGTSDLALVPNDHPLRPESRTQNRGRRLSIAAAAVLVIAGVVATATIGLRDDQKTEQSASDDLPAQSQTTSEPPAWFTAIATHLPGGFTRLGITGSTDEYVNFEAFNPSTSQGLDITISRGPMAPDPDGAVSIDEAQNADWTGRSPNGLNISLNDGRQLGVGCLTMTLDESDCAPINGQVVDPEQLRQLLLALATNILPSDLPAPAEVLDHITSEQVDQAVSTAIDLEQQYQLSLPHVAFSFAAYGAAEDAPTQVHVRTITGLVDTATDQPADGEVDLPNRRIAWTTMNDGTIWVVTTDLDLEPSIGRQILDSARRIGPVPVSCLFGSDRTQIGPLAAASLISRLQQALIDGTALVEAPAPQANGCAAAMTVEQTNTALEYLRDL